MPTIYSNADVAAQLNCKLNSLNKKRSRLTSSQDLTEGEHWFKQDGDIFWTQAGIDVLQQGQAIVPAGGQPLSLAEDTPPSSCPSLGDLPSPAEVARDKAPVIVQRYLAAVDDAIETEVTRILSQEDELKKHLQDQWGIAS